MKNSRRRFITQSGKAIAAASLLSYPIMGENLINKKFKLSNDTVNIGVIGTGGRGNWLIKLIGQIEGMKVMACCDIIPERLSQGLSLAEPNAKSYIDYRKLLENKEIDGVIIATPLSLHYEMANSALLSGKNVYCEKTMVFTYDQINKLEKTYSASGKVFQVGYQHRYNKLYTWVKDFVKSEKFGTLTHIEGYWNRNTDWRRPVSDPKLERLINWRLYNEYSGGLIAELSSHQFDIVGWVTENHPIKVAGFGGIDYWKDGRETFDNVHVIFEYENGLKANYSCLSANAQMGYQMKFYGSNATIQIKGEQGHQVYLYLEPKALEDKEISSELDAVSGATKKVLEAGDPVQINMTDNGNSDDVPTSNALAAFAQCVRDNKEPLVNFENGKIGSVEVIMANMALENGNIEHWPKNI